MRSHTGEKPFYCSIPECAKVFSRADALSKHMRIAHDADALRGNEPFQKQFGDGKYTSIVVGNTAIVTGKNEVKVQVPENDEDFTGEKATMSEKKRLKMLKRKLKWALADRDRVAKEYEIVDKRHRRIWLEKNLAFDKLLKKEGINLE